MSISILLAVEKSPSTNLGIFEKDSKIFTAFYLRVFIGEV